MAITLPFTRVTSFLGRPLCGTLMLMKSTTAVRNLSFSFAGPRRLDEIIKKELVKDKSGAEVAEIWYKYHEEKVR